MSRAARLTGREQQVLREIARGYSNREIAARLNISVRTTEVHRYHIMTKLDTKNVAQLLRAALRRRLLTMADLLPPARGRKR
ncbi:MAG: helix-turn-helix transcriptional regulator [Nitrospirota bacterium]